jgi:hypothetical protein
MPKFNVTVPHSLTQEEARQRLDRFSEFAGGSDKVSNLEQSWQDNALHFGFKTFGIAIKGVAEVADHQVNVDGEIPFSAMMFKGKIEAEVQKFLSKLLGG